MIQIVTCSQIDTDSIRKIQIVTDSITTIQLDTDSIRMIQIVTDSIRMIQNVTDSIGVIQIVTHSIRKKQIVTNSMRRIQIGKNNRCLGSHAGVMLDLIRMLLIVPDSPNSLVAVGVLAVSLGPIGGLAPVPDPPGALPFLLQKPMKKQYFRTI